METKLHNTLVLNKFYSIDNGGNIRRMSRMKSIDTDLLGVSGISSLDESEMQEIT